MFSLHPVLISPITNSDKWSTHKPSQASQSTLWGRPWAALAWRCTAGQCSPSAAAECCVSAHTAHTPSSSVPLRCLYFQMPWRQLQPFSVTCNLCSGEGGGGLLSFHDCTMWTWWVNWKLYKCLCLSRWEMDRQKAGECEKLQARVRREQGDGALFFSLWSDKTTECS